MELRREDIVADDAGVTVTRFGRRPRSIAWDDIALLLQFGEEQPEGNTYWLRGQYGVALALGGADYLPRVSGGPPASAFTFAASDGSYPDAMQRLLATVSARAHVTVRVLTVQSTRSARRANAR